MLEIQKLKNQRSVDPGKMWMSAFQRGNQNHGDTELEQTSRGHSVPQFKFSPGWGQLVSYLKCPENYDRLYSRETRECAFSYYRHWTAGPLGAVNLSPKQQTTKNFWTHQTSSDDQDWHLPAFQQKSHEIKILGKRGLDPAVGFLIIVKPKLINVSHLDVGRQRPLRGIPCSVW